MIPPVFALLSASSTGLVALQLGAGALCRVYPFGDAPEGVARPYVTWQIVAGEAHAVQADTPGSDRYLVQIDTWGDDVASLLSAAEPVRYELERAGNVVSYGGAERDPETGRYRYSFDWEYVARRGIYPPLQANEGS